MKYCIFNYFRCCIYKLHVIKKSDGKKKNKIMISFAVILFYIKNIDFIFYIRFFINIAII